MRFLAVPTRGRSMTFRWESGERQAPKSLTYIFCYRPVSSAPDGGTSQFHGYPGTYGFRKGQRQRSAGMKGEFRNGFFYDEDGPQEQRNIQYDLDPEKMEKIWVRREKQSVDNL